MAKAVKSNPINHPALAAQLRKNSRVQILVNGVAFNAPQQVKEALLRAIASAANLPAEMTTTRAAEFLDISRPLLVKLVLRGELPHRRVGSHRRIPTEALIAYRDKQYQQARTAVDETTSAAQDMGLYELEGPLPKRK